MSKLIFILIIGKTLVLKNINLVDVKKGEIFKADVVIEDSIIKKILSPGKAKGEGITFSSKYLIPSFIDVGVYLFRSPGGNVLVKESSPLVRRQNLYSFTLSGITTVIDAATNKEWEKELKEDEFTPSIYFMGPTYILPNFTHRDFYPYDKWARNIFDESYEIVNKERFNEYYFGNTGRVKIILASSFYKEPLNKYKELLLSFIKFLKRKEIEPIAYVETTEDAHFAKTCGIKLFYGYPQDGEDIFYSPHLVFYKAPIIDYNKYELPYTIKSSLEIPFAYHTINFNNKVKEKATKFYNTFSSQIRKIKQAKLVVSSSAGNPLLFPGHSFIEEMKNLEKVGIMPIDILRGATIYAAQFANFKDRGIIEEGKLADLIVLNSNPLENIEAVESPYLIIKRGKIVTLPKLKWKITYGEVPLSPWDFPQMIDDFNDGDRKTFWGTSLDDTLYTFGYRGKTEVVRDGANNSPYALKITGKLSENYRNLAFMGAVIPIDPKGWIGLYMKAYDGLEFFTRGDGKKYKISFITDITKDYRYPSYQFETDNEWKRIYIPVKEIKGLDTMKVCAISITPIEIGKGEFELFLDNLKFYYSSSKIKIIEYGKKLLATGWTLYDEDMLNRALLLFERASQDKDTLSTYFYALTNYRLGIFHRRNKKKSKLHFKLACDLLEKLDWQSAEKFALLASIYGNLIGLNPLGGMFLGRKVENNFKRAVEADSTNPRVFYLLGLSKLFTPPMFGGGLDKAISNFKKAKTLFEKNEKEKLINWGYDENLAWLGYAYLKQEEKEKAVEFFKLALKENPYYGFPWWRLIKIGE